MIIQKNTCSGIANNLLITAKTLDGVHKKSVIILWKDLIMQIIILVNVSAENIFVLLVEMKSTILQIVSRS
jgi:hypothetical protein